MDSPICQRPDGICSFPVELETLSQIDQLALMIFAECQTQWEITAGMSAVTIRLPYSDVRAVVESHGFPWAECSLLMERIRICERTLMHAHSERQRESRSIEDEEDAVN